MVLGYLTVLLEKTSRQAEELFKGIGFKLSEKLLEKAGRMGFT